MRYGFLVTHSSHLFAFPGYPAKVLLEAPIVLEALPQTILEMDVVPDLSDKNQMDITPASRTRLSRVSRAGRPKLQDDAIQDDSETTVSYLTSLLLQQLQLTYSTTIQYSNARHV